MIFGIILKIVLENPSFFFFFFKKNQSNIFSIVSSHNTCLEIYFNMLLRYP